MFFLLIVRRDRLCLAVWELFLPLEIVSSFFKDYSSSRRFGSLISDASRWASSIWVLASQLMPPERFEEVEIWYLPPKIEIVSCLGIPKKIIFSG